MTLTLELTPEEARRVEEARRRGVDVDALLRHVIGQIPQEAQSPTVGQEILAAWQQSGVIGSRPEIIDSQTHARTLQEQTRISAQKLLRLPKEEQSRYLRAAAEHAAPLYESDLALPVEKRELTAFTALDGEPFCEYWEEDSHVAGTEFETCGPMGMRE